MVWPDITSSAEYIAFGSTWRDGSGSFLLLNDISFSAQQLNDVSNNDLYTGFNATFNGNNKKITIEKYGGGTNVLNHGLIKDLCGGTLTNLYIDVSGIDINFGAPYGETGIIVTHPKTFNIGSSRGSFGLFSNLKIHFENCRLTNPGNSALFPKYFGSNGAGNVNMQNITISGTLIANNHSGCGIIGTEMFYNYNSTAEFIDISSSVILDDGLSIFGTNFGKKLNNSGTIEMYNIINTGNILNNASSDSGSIIGNNAFIDSFGGNVFLNSLENRGIIYKNNIGGIVGKNMAGNSSDTLQIQITECHNKGTIIGPNCGGIVGEYANEAGRSSIKIMGCTNIGTIQGNNSGGIVGGYLNNDSSGNIEINGCINYGNIIGENVGGIVGYGCGYHQKSQAVILIKECMNYGDIDCLVTPNIFYGNIDNTHASAGIVGSKCGAYSGEGSQIKVLDCVNHVQSSISGNGCAGIVSLGLNYNGNGSVLISGCINNGQIEGNNSAGISAGMIGINHTGTITVINCKNTGTIIGEETAGIISVLGHNYNNSQETSGQIAITNCTNTGDNIGGSTSTAGLISTIILSPSAYLSILINDCSNTGINLDTGILYNIIDVSENQTTTTNNILINNCSTSEYGVTSDIIGKISTQHVNGTYNTEAIITVQYCKLNTNASSIYDSHKFLIGEIGNILSVPLKRKSILLFSNVIDVPGLHSSEDVSLVGDILNLHNSNLYIQNNDIVYREITNVVNVSGVLNYKIQDLTNCIFNISQNRITLNNIDNLSVGLTGIQLLHTENDENSSYINSNIDFSIEDNTISTNTPYELTRTSNGTIFGSIDVSPVPNYIGPNGILTIQGNTLSSELSSISLTYYSDYYFPSELRPYLYNLVDVDGSRFWWKNQLTFIDIPSDIIPVKHSIDLLVTDDTNLRRIFNRAIKAINEQIHFGIYNFYHLKVKGNAILH